MIKNPEQTVPAEAYKFHTILPYSNQITFSSLLKLLMDVFWTAGRIIPLLDKYWEEVLKLPLHSLEHRGKGIPNILQILQNKSTKHTPKHNASHLTQHAVEQQESDNLKEKSCNPHERQIQLENNQIQIPTICRLMNAQK